MISSSKDKIQKVVNPINQVLEIFRSAKLISRWEVHIDVGNYKNNILGRMAS
jgi:hypothetical protein